MHAEDRSIHFSTELFHRPVTHELHALQKLYYVLSQSGCATYQNTDFNTPGQPKFYTRRGQRTQSIVVFLPDRIVLIEEWADIALPQYLERMASVLEVFLRETGAGPFTAQTSTLRSACAVSHFPSAVEFLMDRACGQKGRIAPYFKRPVAVGGLRFVLPETPTHPGALHVCIEPFRMDPREIFVEVKGVFAGEPLDAERIPALCERVAAIREFVTECIYPYLNQFDVPAERFE